jgi:hypothetical protein
VPTGSNGFVRQQCHTTQPVRWQVEQGLDLSSELLSDRFHVLALRQQPPHGCRRSLDRASKFGLIDLEALAQ